MRHLWFEASQHLTYDNFLGIYKAQFNWAMKELKRYLGSGSQPFKNSSVEVDSALIMTNQIGHVISFSFSDWSRFKHRVKLYAGIFTLSTPVWNQEQLKIWSLQRNQKSNHFFLAAKKSQKIFSDWKISSKMQIYLAETPATFNVRLGFEAASYRRKATLVLAW